MEARQSQDRQSQSERTEAVREAGRPDVLLRAVFLLSQQKMVQIKINRSTYATLVCVLLIAAHTNQDVRMGYG